MADEKDGVWRTVSGRRIFIRTGQSLSDAMQESGKFKKEKGPKYSPMPRRNQSGISVAPKRYTKLCGIMNTNYPNLKAGDRAMIFDAKYQYDVIADGYGGMIILSKYKNVKANKKGRF